MHFLKNNSSNRLSAIFFSQSPDGTRESIGRLPFLSVLVAGLFWMSLLLFVSYAAAHSAKPQPSSLPVLFNAPEIKGLSHWINSEKINSMKELRGKVILVDFWTYSCFNCINTFPYVQAWHEKYAKDGLVVLGIHAPEFSFERKLDNVKQAVKKHGLTSQFELNVAHIPVNTNLEVALKSQSKEEAVTEIEALRNSGNLFEGYEWKIEGCDDGGINEFGDELKKEIANRLGQEKKIEDCIEVHSTS